LVQREQVQREQAQRGGVGRGRGEAPRGGPVYNVAFPVEKSSGLLYALIKV
jgi:hypothetical protein